MKLIIDIPEEEYKMRVLWAKSDNLCSPDTIWIAKGLPYEKNIKVVAKEAYDQGYTDGWKERYGEPDGKPRGEWLVTAEDNDGVHRICCPFCSYEKGSNNTDTIIVTFSNFPKFCENCGADMQKGGAKE